MRASATAGESTYAGILRMVSAAQTAKSPFIRMADRYALLLLPTTLLIACGAWLYSSDPVRGLAVLVAATPCPLILAAPVAFISGVARAAKRGILVKGSGPLEVIAQTHTVMFDKTGTLKSVARGSWRSKSVPTSKPPKYYDWQRPSSKLHITSLLKPSSGRRGRGASNSAFRRMYTKPWIRPRWRGGRADDPGRIASTSQWSEQARGMGGSSSETRGLAFGA